MTANELCGRMNNDVSSMFDRTNEVRSAEGVVDDERNVMTMSNLCKTVDICDVRVWIAESLSIERLGVRLDGCLYFIKVAYINDSVCNTLCCQCVSDEVERAAIKVVGCYHMVAILKDVLQSVGYGSSTRSNCESGYTTLKGCNTIFEYSLSGVS